MGAEEIRAVLSAYRLVARASFPALHPNMETRARAWHDATEAVLGEELAGYLKEAAPPHSHVRIFWKLGPRLIFSGGNQLFAHDAGFADMSVMIGMDEFDDRLPWRQQAAKYRADDEEVIHSGQPNLDIVERQAQPDGVVWLHVGKAPIRTKSGDVIGLFGMYEVLADDRGRRLYAERLREAPGTGPGPSTAS
jgi:hypothetical protein